MNIKFKDIQFPPTYKYSSDSDYIPLEFYEDTFPISKSIDLLLGYFSSNAIKVLSRSFAEFVFNEGKLRIVTNHFLSSSDFENLIQDKNISDEDKIIDIFGDIEKLQKELSKEGQHFFDCLRYLQKEGRLEILPVKFNKFDLAHCKRMILFDGENYISTDGSINFTLSALIRNAESFQIDTSWGGEVSIARIKEERELFEKIITKTHPDYSYIDNSEIEVIINKIGQSKDIQDLMEDSIELTKKSRMNEKVIKILKKKKERFESIVEEINTKPKFPFGSPRDYQVLAYKNWLSNKKQGLFAMATGTGKTITALNCILEEYKLNGIYKFIVLVPTRALVEQWEKEIINNFNFQNLISVRNKYFYEELKYEDKNENSCLLVTYATFKSSKFQKIFNRINHKNDFTLIADEAHNMGSAGFLKILNSLDDVKKRIGLSATPSRYFDDVGEMEVFKFFNTKIDGEIPKFTYSFSISEAINAKPKPFLCKYKYKIKFVELQNDELTKYRKYTRDLLNFLDKDGRLKRCIEVESILKKRKDIIKKAKNKKSKLIEIVEEIGVEKFKYAFVYVPEGKEIDYSEDDSDWSEFSNDDFGLISDYTKEINEKFNNRIPIRHFTGKSKDRGEILNHFSKGQYSALFAMKCLDEGVDVPRTEIAIFCSSTGNPRQYIQRRGRVLRLHDDKKEALIYDMIVIPILEDLNDSEKEYKTEANLVKGEVRRLIEFAKDSLSLDEVLLNKDLIKVCDFFKINIDEFLK